MALGEMMKKEKKKISSKINKNIVKKVVLVIIVLMVAIAAGFGIYKLYQNYITEKATEYDWIAAHVSFNRNNNIGNNVITVNKNDHISVFDMDYQEIIDNMVNEELQNNIYEFSNPLLILNPYGTNTTGLNLYFTSESDDYDLEYKISVDDDDIQDYEAKATSHGEDGNYAYQIIGLVPGYTNTLELTLIDGDETVEEQVLELNIPELSSNKDISITIDTEDGDSDEELSDGLYTFLGWDKNYTANTYLYDNNGTFRAELVLDGYRSDRVIEIDDNILYSNSKNSLILVNPLGKIEKTYTLDGYEMHHDYIYDEENDRLLILANKLGTDTIEDHVIELNLENGKIKDLIDMKDLLPEMYDMAESPEGGNTYGGDELDWVHLNSLSLIDEDDLVLSSRELSTIIYVSNINDNPKIKYLIADESMYEDTSYEDLLLDKIGDFTSNAGQHTITYEYDDSLDDGQYYLVMFNNNYSASRTRPFFDWSNYEGTGDYNNGEKSMYYKYLVDENENTYELVESVDLDYSSIVSSVEDMDNGNMVASSGKSNSFAEYDSAGNLIRHFSYPAKKYSYRVFKYEYNNWFE